MKITKVLSAITLVAIIAAAGSLSAKQYPHEEAGVSVNVPNNWDVDGDNDSLEASSPDEMTFLFFQVLEAKNFEAAMQELVSSIQEEVDNFQPDGKLEERNLNGMNALVGDATGKIEGTPVELGVVIVESPSGKYIMVFGLTAAPDNNPYKKQVMQIMNSLKPIK